MTKLLRLADIPERLSEEEFWALFGRNEHETLDFKRGVGDGMKKAMALQSTGRSALVLLWTRSSVA